MFESPPWSNDGANPIGGRQAFANWREERPFSGGVLLTIAGVIIAWMPIHVVWHLLLGSGPTVVGTPGPYIGVLFAVLVFVTGVSALRLPERSRELGIIGVALSILSLYGALGGLFVGMIVGILGGSLCYAWDSPSVSDEP